jgi:uncharacterized membrane-anchored protein
VPARETRRAAPWDPAVTVGLLVLGVINTTQSVAQARELGSTLDALYAAQGIGHYTDVAAANAAGLAMSLSSVLCLVLAIGFAVPRIRSQRTAFWIPIVCAVVSVVVTIALVIVAMLVDPAFATYLQQHSG